MEAAKAIVPAITVRAYKPEDYNTLVSWWKQYTDWEKNPVPEGILPPTGIIVMQDDKPICAGFLYETIGNNCTWMEWIVADAQSDKETRAICLDKLVKTLTNIAKVKGYGFIFTSVKHPKLMERLESFGFLKGDGGMTNMIKGLK